MGKESPQEEETGKEKFIPACEANFIYFITFQHFVNFPDGSMGRICPQCRRHRRHGLDPWFRKIPWSREWQSTSVFLVWKIPWTEEHGGLPSMRSQRVRHN